MFSDRTIYIATQVSLLLLVGLNILTNDVGDASIWLFLMTLLGRIYALETKE